MYETFYNLKTRPFENTPDPRFFFASEQHREALAAIEYTIRFRKGFVLVTGHIGAGKTMVGRTMCHRCGQAAQIVHVLHGHQDDTGLIRQILRSLRVRTCRADDLGRMLERLREYVVGQLHDGLPVVLFVDEAQTLSDASLEQLRLLSSFDTATQKAVQVVLIGQPELRQRIRNPQCAALRQRIVLAKQLSPLDQQETGAYLAHRLRIASADPEHVQVQFDPTALGQIYDFCGGVPRLINVMADNCLLLGYVRQTREISPTIVQRVMQDQVPDFDDEPAGTQLHPQSHRLAANF